MSWWFIIFSCYQHYDVKFYSLVWYVIWLWLLLCVCYVVLCVVCTLWKVFYDLSVCMYVARRLCMGVRCALLCMYVMYVRCAYVKYVSYAGTFVYHIYGCMLRMRVTKATRARYVCIVANRVNKPAGSNAWSYVLAPLVWQAHPARC